MAGVFIRCNFVIRLYEVIAFTNFWSERELSFGSHALVISVDVSMSSAIERDCTAIGKMALKKAPKAVQRKSSFTAARNVRYHATAAKAE